ncbi:DnaJ domain [Trypanosoma melophagium]|uniref:DnaJ domain n=1 Tax=Trypanosoma melophagium TaxID=715481 RepID=UPI00351A243D|nr:DnaJ domain [Trypanosoma melophagium]
MAGDLERSRRLYQTLLLPDFSGVDEVRQAYKALALKYHPDKNLHDPSAAEKFREVRVAYEILSSEERKRKYDCTLRLFQPLGSSSFAPGGRGVPSATGESGMFSSSPIGNATSCIYEELFNYAAKKAERQQRRASPSRTPRGDRASQYTKEQKEFFRKREKEHQAELRKRLEQEKREQRAKELEALRREQERREEALQRSQQRRPRTTVSSRAYSSMGIRRSSPFPRPATEQTSPQSDDLKKKFAKSNSAREMHMSSSLPETVRAVPSPRHRRPSLDIDAERADRVRREKERQAEVRRGEQEKYLDRLMRQRIREARLREREAEEELRREIDNQQQLLVLAEKSEREQVLAPQEQLERRRLWREWQQEMRGRIMSERRIGLVVAHKEALSHLRNSEATDFAYLELHFREGFERVCLVDEYSRLLREEANELQKMGERTLVKEALGDGCAAILHEEYVSRSLLQVLLDEWKQRLELQQEEDKEILELIRRRANERQTVHLADEERTRILERKINAATIALLQKEIQELKLALQPGFSPLRTESVTSGGITTIPRYPAETTQYIHQESLGLSGNGTCNGDGCGNSKSGNRRVWVESSSVRIPHRGTPLSTITSSQSRCPSSTSTPTPTAAAVPLLGVEAGEAGALRRTVLAESKVSMSPLPLHHDSVHGNSSAGNGFSKVTPTSTPPSLEISFNSREFCVVAATLEPQLLQSSLHRNEGH